MKKFFIYAVALVASAMVCTSCEKHNNPEIVIKPSRLFMVVGDVAAVEVDGAKKVYYNYSKTRDESKPVFEYKEAEHVAYVHALNPGTDTLFIVYQWSRGMWGADADGRTVIITVFDN